MKCAHHIFRLSIERSSDGTWIFRSIDEARVATLPPAYCLVSRLNYLEQTYHCDGWKDVFAKVQSRRFN